MSDPAPVLRIRRADTGDVGFLWEMLRLTSGWRGEPPTLEKVRSEPSLSHYVAGWTPEQLGIIVDEPLANGTGSFPVGAAWLRMLTRDDPGYGFVRDGIPELAMAVVPGRRSGGLGKALLDALVILAQQARLPGISLSVERENVRAVTLYRSCGFQVTGRVGDSDTMLLAFTGGPTW